MNPFAGNHAHYCPSTIAMSICGKQATHIFYFRHQSRLSAPRIFLTQLFDWHPWWIEPLQWPFSHRPSQSNDTGTPCHAFSNPPPASASGGTCATLYITVDSVSFLSYF